MRNCEDLFLFEKDFSKKNATNKKQSDEYILKFWTKHHPEKKFLKATDRLYSHDTLSLIKSEKKSVMSEIDISGISYIKEMIFKKKIKRSLSSSSLNNILKGFISDEEEEQIEKNKKPGKSQIDSFNFDSLNEYLRAVKVNHSEHLEPSEKVHELHKNLTSPAL